MKTIYKVWVVMVVVVLIGGLLMINGSKDSRSYTVRIGYLPVVHALPLYLAIDKGYFGDAGLKIEVTKFEAPNQIVDALLSDQIDISMAGATGITAVAESKKPGSLKIFAIAGGDDAHIADRIIVRRDSLFATVADLKGKKVGVLPGIQWRTIAQNLFVQNGFDIKSDVSLVELAVPLQVQALASGQVDALLAIEPVLTLAESQGISRTLEESPNLRYISNPFYPGVGNASTVFINNHSDVFKKVLSVLEKATDEVNADIDAARPHLEHYTPLSGDLLQKVNLPIYKMYTDVSLADVAAVQKFIDVFVKFKVIETAVHASDLLYKP